MSRWEEEFESNPLHVTLEGIRKFLDAKLDDPNSDVALEKRRLEKVLDLLDVALEQIDKEIAPIALLNQINGHLRHQSFWNQLATYNTNPDAGYLQTANNHINSQIPIFYQLANFSSGKKTTRITKPVEKAFDDFCVAVDAKAKVFDEKLGNQNTTLEAVTANHESLVEKMAALEGEHEGRLSQWQGEFTDNQTTRAEEFSTAQIQKEKSYADWLGTFTETSNGKIESLTADQKEKLEKFFEQFKAKIAEYQEDAHLKHNAILDIHDLVATDGVAGGYKSTADDEGKVANTWRLGAFVFLGAAALWLGAKLYFGVNALKESGVNWEEIVTSISLTGILLAAAVYASKQSSFHRNNEKKMRWFALEVKAIDPFLASLGEDDQKKLKAQICERIFGQSDGSDNHETENFDPNIIKVISDSFVEGMKSLSKSK